MREDSARRLNGQRRRKPETKRLLARLAERGLLPFEHSRGFPGSRWREMAYALLENRELLQLQSIEPSARDRLARAAVVLGGRVSASPNGAERDSIEAARIDCHRVLDAHWGTRWDVAESRLLGPGDHFTVELDRLRREHGDTVRSALAEADDALERERREYVERYQQLAKELAERRRASPPSLASREDVDLLAGRLRRMVSAAASSEGYRSAPTSSRLRCGARWNFSRKP